MTWLLMWLNVSVATLNATLQLLVIYRYRCAARTIIHHWLYIRTPENVFLFDAQRVA